MTELLKISETPAITLFRAQRKFVNLVQQGNDAEAGHDIIKAHALWQLAENILREHRKEDAAEVDEAGSNVEGGWTIQLPLSRSADIAFLANLDF